MNVTYSITNIKPVITDVGLIDITFDITATDEVGNTKTESGRGHGPFPEPKAAILGYTQDELTAICQNAANDSNLLVHLKNSIDGMRTPLYVPPVLAPISDDERRNQWMAQVDTNAANVYNLFTRFEVEYEQREKAAQTYKDAGYTGDPTVWITAFADSNGIDYNTCADLILSQAETLRQAVVQLGVLRMNKYKIKNAATLDDANTAFLSIINDIATLARSLP